MQVMRWNQWIGLSLAAIGLLFGIYSFLFPHAQVVTETLSLADGTQAQLTARIPDRGWAGDNTSFSLKVTTQTSSNAAALLHLGARLEMGNVEVSPAGIVKRSLDEGDSTLFTWQVKAYTVGLTPGILWLYQTDATRDNYALYGKEFSFSANDYWGISPLIARIGAAVVFMAGLLLWFVSSKNRQKLSPKKK
jgi:hypothetical protein